MASFFALTGSYTATPGSGYPSGDPLVTASLDERMGLGNEVVSQAILTTDAPYALPMSGLSSANLVVLKVLGGPITLKITSAAGVAQSIIVDSFFTLFSNSADITALEVVRTPATQTVVKYFLGKKA